MINYLFLLFGHLLGEGLFSGWLTHAKRRSLFFLGIHSAIYAIIAGTFLYLFFNRIFAFWMFGILFGSHFVIDYWKCFIVKSEANINASNYRYSILDQILHLSVLAFLII